MWYNLEINKLIELLTPTFLRKEKLLAWLRSLHFPLQKVLDDFHFERKQNLYNLSHNGQMCYLRKVLNDKFDISERRIKITDGNRFKRQYIYTDGEQKPKFLGTMCLRDDADYEDTGVDFIVLIPARLQHDEYEMEALIDFYKLASKRYKIQNY
ncbi:hypothetical protein [Bergeyella cardium]|uniref:Uncharacterized protein n=1 Tax=Bergeyella cardium TaxID=1585976 RepID=A0A6P1QSS5_9FLAO|nr:hypothetical protein [Bergeyella cardium]QHN64839.1 hypothetical protein DBX24_02495 [Bergeyella cardium]WHE34146.1 hypothetical protein P8603_02510 [Bergeyella cardium]WHF60797.1 hypothetical protein O0R51_02505 [Bergeyella cardium]